MELNIVLIIILFSSLDLAFGMISKKFLMQKHIDFLLSFLLQILALIDSTIRFFN